MVILPNVSEIKYYCHCSQCLGDFIIWSYYPMSRRFKNIVIVPSVSENNNIVIEPSVSENNNIVIVCIVSEIL